jgi:hypothetical protein
MEMPPMSLSWIAIVLDGEVRFSRSFIVIELPFDVHSNKFVNTRFSPRIADSHFKEKRLCRQMAFCVFISSRLPLMPAKRGIKKNQLREVNKNLEPAYHNSSERKGQFAAERVITPFLTSIALLVRSSHKYLA